MSPSAIELAHRGQNPRPATFKQRRYLGWLARQAGVEEPIVSWARDANRAIRCLRGRLRQPALW